MRENSKWFDGFSEISSEKAKLKKETSNVVSFRANRLSFDVGILC